MFEFLGDPTVQFAIIVALTILSVIGPIIVYWKQRARKSLQFHIVSHASLFSIREEAKGEIEIRYRGTKVEDADLVLIEVSNAGDVPIKVEEYEEPIIFDFGEKAQVLTAEVTEREPENLKMQSSIDGKTVSLTPALMNPGDSVTLKVIATTIGEEIRPNCRIVGVKEMEEAKPARNISWIAALSIAVSYASLFGSIVSSKSNNVLLTTFLIIVMVGGLAISLVLVIWEFIKWIQTRQRRRSARRAKQPRLDKTLPLKSASILPTN